MGSTAMTIRDARGFLTSSEVMEQITLAVARTIDPDRLVRVAITAMTRNPKLLECTKASLVLALQEAGVLGLEPTGVLGHAYLVPYWNRDANALEAQFQIGYQGIRTLARRSPEIRDVSAEVVREGDEFRYQKGLDPQLVHVPLLSTEVRPATFFYAISWWTSGHQDFEVMNRAQVEQIRARSKAKDSGPWVTDFDEMGRKTVIRRHGKHLPLTAEAHAVIAYDDAVEYEGNRAVRLQSYLAGNIDGLPEPPTPVQRAAAASRGTLARMKQEMQARALPEPQGGSQPSVEPDSPVMQEPDGPEPETGAPEPPAAAPPQTTEEAAKERYLALWDEVGTPSGKSRSQWQVEQMGGLSTQGWSLEDYRKACELLEQGVGLGDDRPPG